MLAIATIALGIVPATLLAFFILLVSIGLFESSLSRSVSLVSGTLALFAFGTLGYVSLWLTLRKLLSLGVVLGLCAGMVSAAVGAVLLWDEAYLPRWALVYFFGGPILVAGVHLLRYTRRRAARRSTP
jgi:hypothetical protein